MLLYLAKRRASVHFRLILAFVVVAFIIAVVSAHWSKTAGIADNETYLSDKQTYASALGYMPAPTEFINTTSDFNLPTLKGIQIHPENPFKFDFIIDEGNGSGFSTRDGHDRPLQKEAQKLIKYFLASITIPEKDLWVNLSPYEQDKIIPEELGLTDMGKDLLGEDYILKQLLASLTYPQSPLGKRFWKKVYQRAHQLFGTAKIPINTFNKIWIVPDKAIIYEDNNQAFIKQASLKVMLEEDYLGFVNRKRMTENRRQITEDRGQTGEGRWREVGDIELSEEDEKDINNFSSSIMKEIILPAIEKEVNNGKNFAYLRQIYHSLILAVWFKQKLKQGLLNNIYIDKKKIKGIDTNDPQIKEKIYNQYVQAFKEGLYDYIKKDFDPASGKYIRRRYYSGGADFREVSSAITISKLPEDFSLDTITSSPMKVAVKLEPSRDGHIKIEEPEKEKTASSAVKINKEVHELFNLVKQDSELINNINDMFIELKRQGKPAEEIQVSLETYLQDLLIRKISKTGNRFKTEEHSIALGKMIAAKRVALDKIKSAFKLIVINFQDGGQSHNTYSKIVESCLNSLPAVKIRPNSSLPIIKEKVEKIDDISKIVGERAKFIQALGRTLIFKTEDNAYIGVKLQKGTENIDTLQNEYNILSYIQKNKKRLVLRGTYPEPLKEPFYLKVIPSDMLKAVEKAAKDNEGVDKSFQIYKDKTRGFPYTAMAYKVCSFDYFTYLNDTKRLDYEEFTRASVVSLYDLGRLAREGIIHTALADVFHLMGGKGKYARYLWMADIVAPGSGGTGRLHAWPTAATFPNMRKSGLADFADFMLLKDLTQPDNPYTVDLEYLQRFGDKKSSFFLASYLGDYMLAWILTAGTYLRSNEEIFNWQNPDKLADFIKQGYAQLYESFTSEKPQEIENLIDWGILARQMSFFMTSAYVEYVKEQQMPEGMFDKNTLVLIDSVTSFRGWRGDQGWMLDKRHPDLGPVNGPFPLQELIKANYIYSMFMIAGLTNGETAGPPIENNRTASSASERKADTEPVAHSVKGLRLQPINLYEELEKSGLSAEQIELLKKNSKGIMTIYEFLAKFQSEHGGYAFGLGTDLYYYYSMISNLTVYQDAYYKDALNKFGFDKFWEIFAKNGTEDLFNWLTSEQKPIVFFVPRDVFTYHKAEYTKEEIEWFLNHPERMGNTYFIFGAYQAISSEDWKQSEFSLGENLLFSPKERHKIVTENLDAFRDLIKQSPILLAEEQTASSPAKQSGNSFTLSIAEKPNSTEIEIQKLLDSIMSVAKLSESKKLRVIDKSKSLAGADDFGNVILLRLIIEKYKKGEITKGELAFIIGHELAHQESGHTAEFFTLEALLEYAEAGVVVPKGLPWDSEFVPTKENIEKKYHSMEYEADLRATELIIKLGFSLEDAINILKKLPEFKNKAVKNGEIVENNKRLDFKYHPNIHERINYITESFLASAGKETSSSAVAEVAQYSISTTHDEEKGGIDLNLSDLDLEILSRGSSPVSSPAYNLIDIQNFQGFTFRILRIERINNPDKAFAGDELVSAVK